LLFFIPRVHRKANKNSVRSSFLRCPIPFEPSQI
jgi:hypothetical protein